MTVCIISTPTQVFKISLWPSEDIGLSWNPVDAVVVQASREAARRVPADLESRDSLTKKSLEIFTKETFVPGKQIGEHLKGRKCMT